MTGRLVQELNVCTVALYASDLLCENNHAHLMFTDRSLISNENVAYYQTIS